MEAEPQSKRCVSSRRSKRSHGVVRRRRDQDDPNSTWVSSALVQDRALHLSHELVHLERLPADERGAEEARDLSAISTAAHDDDRHFIRVRSSFTPTGNELRAVGIRESDVEDHRGRLARERSPQGLTSIDRGDHVEARIGQAFSDQPANVVVVLDDQDASIKSALHLFLWCHSRRQTASDRLRSERYIPRRRSANGTSKRRAKSARAERDGATRPVSIFHTYWRWQYTTPLRLSPSSAIVSPLFSRSSRIRFPTLRSSRGSPGTSGFTRAGTQTPRPRQALPRRRVR